ncbi:MAG: T9SS type A sorting domain-containing protein [Ignavibacteria bacterium]|nr:T9SS type A sorting domain-containing protein [Ignavibacteria bacterium]
MQYRSTTGIVAVLILVSGMLPARAQHAWQRANGPFGGIVTCYASDSNDVYAGTDDGGVYRSSDNGVSWVFASSGINGSKVASLLVANGSVFAALDAGVYRSMDKGATWVHADSGIAKGINALACIGSALYAASNGAGVFLSTNNGASWTAIGPTGAGVYAISLCALGTDLYVGTTNYIYKTTNNGASWQNQSSGIPASGYAIYGLATLGSAIYAVPIVNSSYFGVYVSTNGGAQWTSANGNLSKYVEVETIHTGGTTLYVGTRLGVHASTDNGGSWHAINTGMENVRVRAITGSGSTLLAGSGRGVHRSSNGGAAWTESMTGMTASTIRVLTRDASDVYAGTSWGKIWRTSDEGDSWSLIRLPADATTSAIFFSGSRMFAGTNDGLFRSDDHGISWVPSDTGMIAGITSSDVRSMTKLGANLYAASYGDGIFLSSNNGSSWVPRNNGLAELNVTVVIAKDARLLAATRFEGIHVSSDNGSTWVPSNGGISSKNTHDIGSIGSTLFAATNWGVNRSTNGGASWINPDTLLMRWQTVQCLAAKDSMLYAAADRILLSTNLGNSWAYADSGMPMFQWWGGEYCPAVNDAVATDGFMIAGTSGYGVWRRSVRPDVPVPQPPVLISPADSAANIAVDTLLRWNESAGAASYRLQFGTSISFAAALIDTIVAATSFPVRSLSDGTLYAWRVMAMNAKGGSLWAGPRTFRTVHATPAAVVLRSPPNASVDVPLTPTLQWNTDTGVTGFHLQVSLDAAFSAPLLLDKDTTGGLYALRNLAQQTTYSWRVHAVNSSGSGPWSAVWHFTTIKKTYGLPGLTGPPDHSRMQPLSTSLSWTPAAGAIGYLLQVSLKPDFSAMIVNDTAAASGRSIALDGYTDYFWRVRARYNDGMSEWTPAWTFRSTIAAPLLISPPDASMNVPLNPRLTWRSAAGAMTYHVSVRGSGLTLDQPGIADTSFLVPGCRAGTVYTWRVAGECSEGTGDSSRARSFTTASSTSIEGAGRNPAFRLEGCFPNPCSNHTTITFELPQHDRVLLTVHDALGRTVASLFDGSLTAGRHAIPWSAADAQPGVYLYRIATPSRVASGACIVTR